MKSNHRVREIFSTFIFVLLYKDFYSKDSGVKKVVPQNIYATMICPNRLSITSDDDSFLRVSVDV